MVADPQLQFFPNPEETHFLLEKYPTVRFRTIPLNIKSLSPPPLSLWQPPFYFCLYESTLGTSRK